jgi:hypothetical protein
MRHKEIRVSAASFHFPQIDYLRDEPLPNLRHPSGHVPAG